MSNKCSPALWLALNDQPFKVTLYVCFDESVKWKSEKSDEPNGLLLLKTPALSLIPRADGGDLPKKRECKQNKQGEVNCIRL